MTSRAGTGTSDARAGPDFQALAEANGDGLLVVGAEGAVWYANPAAARLFGTSRDWLRHVPADWRLQPGPPVELSIPRAEGSVDVEVHIADMLWCGRPALVATLREVAPRRQRAARVAESLKLEALGRLSAGITHDFNNLLAVIVSGTELLRQLIARDPADPRVDKLIGDMLGRARNGAALTQQLLTFSRRQPLVPQIVDVNGRLSALTNVLHRALGGHVAIETQLDPQLDPVLIDGDQFEVALFNLAANARDAMDGHGTLTLSTCNRPDRPEGVDAAAESFVRLTISDTGCGMPPEVAARVFEPFFSTKGDEGTGLGLSQVYGSIRQSGGHIRIDSEVGRGTRVHLYLVAVRG